MKKKLLGVVFVMTIVLCCSFAVFAAGVNNSDVKVSINGSVLSMDVPPYIEDGRTLVPIRAISENLKYDVSWDANEKRVDIVNGNDKLALYIGKQQYTKNGQQKQLDVPAKIKDGRTMVPLRLISEEFGCDVSWDAAARMASITKYNVVEAKNVYELIGAIESNTKIVLTGNTYNLSDLDKGTVYNENVFKDELYDGAEYCIIGVSNFAIESPTNATILIKEPYANVLSFKGCENISIKNITAGHDVEKGYCSGGVIYFDSVKGAVVNNCKLYGCGTYGISSYYSENISVTNTQIYDCTYGLVELYYSEKISFDNCDLRNSEGYDMFNIYGCKNVKFSNCNIMDNVILPEALQSSYFINLHESTDTAFTNCSFKDNQCLNFTGEADIELNNCSIFP